MKKLIFLVSAIYGGLLNSFAAKITVDNSPGSAANHSTLSAAITAASSGDTIFVYGSPNSYGAVTVNKKLTIIGSAGFDPEVSNESRPYVQYFILTNGSSGTVISGFNTGYVQTASGSTVDDIGIYNNYFNSTSTGVEWYYSYNSNWTIEGNVFLANGQNNFINNYGNSSVLSNILIKNNYFEMGYYYYYIGGYNNSAFIYLNNLFVIRSNSNSYPLCYACSGVLFTNNIFWVTDAGYTDITGQSCSMCEFNNNIIYNAGGGTMTAINAIGNGVSGSNNIMNQNPQFVNFVQNDGYTITENYRLSSGSPGKNAGSDGSDIGLYGGNYNWENRKYPKAFPHQEILNVINNSVPQGTPVNINLKAKKATN